MTKFEGNSLLISSLLLMCMHWLVMRTDKFGIWPSEICYCESSLSYNIVSVEY